jgi:hypothetical protein
MALAHSIWQISLIPPPQTLVLQVHPKLKVKSLYLGKPIWELVNCVEVTLVSKLHSILCLTTQESRLEKKGSVLNKNCAQFWVDRTSPGQFPE